ncbi:nucleoside 2-deoxyribosyltransferase, partial [Shigella dysenteriae]|nr:nucleoside 2-deoxyribosyltransferase [Shigella dysenteriae]
YMLKEWEYSTGARAENALAEKLELNVLFEEWDSDGL